MQHSQAIQKIKPRQVAIWLGFFGMLFVLWFSNSFLTDRFTKYERGQSLQRAGLYARSISSALQRIAFVPLLLSRDQALIAALQSNDFVNTSQRLISFKEDLSAASIFLLDVDGRVVAASDRRKIGSFVEKPEYFVRALREPETVFQALITETAIEGFYYARKIESGKSTIGVIVVEVDLQRLEQIWRNSSAKVALSNSAGQILMASDILWRRLTLKELQSSTYRPSTAERLFGGEQNEGPQAFVYIDRQQFLVSQVRIGFMGWSLSYFSTLANVQARVNAIIALEIMGLSLIAALVFFISSRRTAQQSVRIKQESVELRRLNARLSAEIEQRQTAEKNLETAEQSLEQASKLATLGQMSAAVSHELNQPLAAMRTYLAGARLLMQRNRIDEAQSSFQRIDDLIERMGAITRQLKSHARKSEDSNKIIDMRDCVTSALMMMGPQLGQTQVHIVRNIAETPAFIAADPVRVEQIIVNLLRNALDAVKTIEDKEIVITVAINESVTLCVQDNGIGIKDPDSLFEPFATTKKPGEGVGLGLAISAGFASDMGGKLTGRNATPVGALFVLQLPRAKSP
ncbi:MAG: ATP-binding protein [Paracoccaceae bacterium]